MMLTLSDIEAMNPARLKLSGGSSFLADAAETLAQSALSAVPAYRFLTGFVAEYRESSASDECQTVGAT